MSPRITVALAVHNGERHLEEAIESVLAQTYTDFELIAVDDGSTDGTPEILSRFHDPRLRVEILPDNRKQWAALNVALEHARGELIGRMDADDRSHPERFARQVAFLDRHPEVGLLGTACYKIDREGRRTELHQVATTDTELKAALAEGCPFVAPSTMMRRSALERVGGYREHRAEDYDLYQRISERLAVANLEEPLLELRRTGDTRVALERDEIMASVVELRDRALERYLNGRDRDGYPELEHRPICGVPFRDLAPSERRHYADTLAARASLLRWQASGVSLRLYRRALLLEPYRLRRVHALLLAELRVHPRLYRAASRVVGR